MEYGSIAVIMRGVVRNDCVRNSPKNGSGKLLTNGILNMIKKSKNFHFLAKFVRLTDKKVLYIADRKQ